ncbi:hypothetical protein ACFWVM_29035 [Nocardia fluminea]|uniref:hypothetical protein n=1 Tax=Nocardia fluminea TaxID=134984 RepID=UPI003661F54B
MIDLDRSGGAAAPPQLTPEFIAGQGNRSIAAEFGTDLPRTTRSPCHYPNYPSSIGIFQIIDLSRGNWMSRIGSWLIG